MANECTLWTKDGKLIKNSEGKLILSRSCPCTLSMCKLVLVITKTLGGYVCGGTKPANDDDRKVYAYSVTLKSVPDNYKLATTSGTEEHFIPDSDHTCGKPPTAPVVLTYDYYTCSKTDYDNQVLVSNIDATTGELYDEPYLATGPYSGEYISFCNNGDNIYPVFSAPGKLPVRLKWHVYRLTGDGDKLLKDYTQTIQPGAQPVTAPCCDDQSINWDPSDIVDYLVVGGENIQSPVKTEVTIELAADETRTFTGDGLKW